MDSSPILVGGQVIFGSDDGRLYMLSAGDGEELWHYDLGESIASSPVYAEGLVVVGCDDGKVYCFEVQGRAVFAMTGQVFEADDDDDIDGK